MEQVDLAGVGDLVTLTKKDGKLCWLNTDSEHICSLAILGQDNRLPWESARVSFENQIDLNYIEDRHFGKDAIVNEEGIRLKAMHYDLLIVPLMI